MVIKSGGYQGAYLHKAVQLNYLSDLFSNVQSLRDTVRDTYLD